MIDPINVAYLAVYLVALVGFAATVPKLAEWFERRFDRAHRPPAE